MPIALIYARASSDPSDLKVSVDRQVKLCTAHAVERWPGAELRVFRDDGITAANPDVRRPGYDLFIQTIRAEPKGSIVGIVANEQSRLTRQPMQWQELVVALTKSGITEVHTLQKGVLSVAEGNQLVSGITALVDADEVARTKLRVQAAHKELFEQGRPSGRPPYGYASSLDAEGRKARVIDPDEAATVERIYGWAREGLAMSVIADKLNAEGIAPRSARWKLAEGRKPVTTWRTTAVRSVLTAPSVAGLRGHTDGEGVLHTTKARWEPIIDPDTWRSVQQLFGRPTTVQGANGKLYPVRRPSALPRRRYLLSGNVLRCARCGSAMIAQTQGRRDGVRVPAYACHPKSGDPNACGGMSIGPADDVEALVVAAMQAALAKSRKLRAKLDANHEGDVAALRVERDRAKADVLDAAQLKGEGVIDRDTWRAMHDPAKARLEAAEAKLTALADAELALPSVEAIIDGWESLTIATQRRVVEALIESVTIHPGRGGRPGFNPDRIAAPIWRA